MTVGRRLRCQITPFEAVLQRRHLRQRYAAAALGGDRQARQHGQLEPFTLGAAQEDLDQLVVFTELADTVADEGSPQEAGQLRGAHAQRTGAILIDVQAHHLARLLPVQMDVGHVRVLADLGGDLPQPAHHIDVLAGDTELHRVTHRRAVLQPRHAAAQAREVLAHALDQPAAQCLADSMLSASTTNWAKLVAGSC